MLDLVVFFLLNSEGKNAILSIENSLVFPCLCLAAVLVQQLMKNIHKSGGGGVGDQEAYLVDCEVLGRCGHLVLLNQLIHVLHDHCLSLQGVDLNTTNSEDKQAWSNNNNKTHKFKVKICHGNTQIWRNNEERHQCWSNNTQGRHISLRSHNK